jgi:hypothetical protein
MNRELDDLLSKIQLRQTINHLFRHFIILCGWLTNLVVVYLPVWMILNWNTLRTIIYCVGSYSSVVDIQLHQMIFIWFERYSSTAANFLPSKTIFIQEGGLGMSITRVIYYPGIESKIFNYPGTRVPDSGNTIFHEMAKFPFKQWTLLKNSSFWEK